MKDGNCRLWKKGHPPQTPLQAFALEPVVQVGMPVIAQAFRS